MLARFLVEPEALEAGFAAIFFVLLEPSFGPGFFLVLPAAAVLLAAVLLALAAAVFLEPGLGPGFFRVFLV